MGAWKWKDLKLVTERQTALVIHMFARLSGYVVCFRVGTAPDLKLVVMFGKRGSPGAWVRDIGVAQEASGKQMYIRLYRRLSHYRTECDFGLIQQYRINSTIRVYETQIVWFGYQQINWRSGNG